MRRRTPILEGKALVVDDEPYYLDWLFEFLESKGYEVESAVNVADACARVSKGIFKMVIVDLNIPAGAGMAGNIAQSEAIMQHYPGMYVAQHARNLGHWDDQVIIYSVHMSEAISEKAKNLYCKYVPKGRPDALKEAIVSALKRAGNREERQTKHRAAKKSETKEDARPKASVRGSARVKTSSLVGPRKRPNRSRCPPGM